MTIEKVYDELYGMIEDLKKKIGGTSAVSITPALESGTKVADYTIGSTEGSLYAPPDFIIDDTAEHIIGATGSGTPIYAKCVNITALPDSAGTVNYPHGITDIDEILLYNAYIVFSTGAITSIPYLVFSAADGFAKEASVSGFVDKTNITIQVGQDRSSAGARVIMLYTKTEQTRTNRRKK